MTDPLSPADPRALYWLPALVFLAHVAEEFPRFPAWATRHFGTTTRAWYVYSHVPLIAGSLTISCLAARGGPGSAWALLATAAAWTLITNALFHCATTVLFREYSPGVVTGVVLLLPAGGYLLAQTLLLQLLTTAQLIAALALGTLAGGLVIASLWLDMRITWRGRLRAAAP